MSAGDRRAARPDGGAGGQLGSRTAHALSAAALALALAAPAQAGTCYERDWMSIAPAGGGASVARFLVERADDEAERARGLMNRREMAADAGMIFVYPSERAVAFWMHDTLIPLDMIFADARGRIVTLYENARPLDDTPIPSGAPVRYVLEINGGQARALGLTPGMVLRLPRCWTE